VLGVNENVYDAKKHRIISTPPARPIACHHVKVSTTRSG